MGPLSPHILYLEDDPDSVELVRFTLEAAGMHLTAGDSIEDFVRLASQQDFDLFLLDGLLPSGYSFEICPRLRSLAPLVPIVFYTALGFPDEVRKGTDAGADEYLIKPYMGDLAETLKKIIAQGGGSGAKRVAPTDDRLRMAAS
ncbi:MAG: response regulator [Acidobacteria bacterium]|nr:response regulator [Acidobacteriota bacterium]